METSWFKSKASNVFFQLFVTRETKQREALFIVIQNLAFYFQQISLLFNSNLRESVFASISAGTTTTPSEDDHSFSSTIIRVAFNALALFLPFEKIVGLGLLDPFIGAILLLLIEARFSLAFLRASQIEAALASSSVASSTQATQESSSTSSSHTTTSSPSSQSSSSSSSSSSTTSNSSLTFSDNSGMFSENQILLTFIEWNSKLLMGIKLDLLVNLGLGGYESSIVAKNSAVLILVILSWFVLIAANVIASEFAYKQIRLDSGSSMSLDSQAKHSPIFKSLLVFLLVFLRSQNQDFLLGAVGFMFATYSMVTRLTQIPKSSFALACFDNVAAAAFFCVTALILAEVIAPESFPTQEFLVGIGFIACVAAMTMPYYERRKFSKYFETGIETSKQSSCEHTLFVCAELLHELAACDVSYTAFMKLTGFLTAHRRVCTISHCPCQAVQRQTDNLGKPTFFMLFKQNFIQFKRLVLDLIEFFLEVKLEESYRRKHDIQNWDLLLKYVDFLIFQMKRFSKAFYELKRFEQKGLGTLMERIIVVSLSNVIEMSAIEEQHKMRFSKKKEDRDMLRESLLFKQIIGSEAKINVFKQDLQSIFELRNHVFQQLIEGYSSSSQYQSDLDRFFILFDSAERRIRYALRDFPQNIHYLRFLIMLRSVCLNDPIESSRFEAILIDNLISDRQKDYNKVTIQSEIAGECVSVIIAYRNYQAQIKSYSLRTPQFFDYPKEEFSTMKSLNPLLPKVIGNIHDQIIKVMVQGGDPRIVNKYRLQFGLSKKGFIFPVNLYVNFCFDHSVSELMFAGFLQKIRNSYEYILVNSGGWITAVSEGFYLFLADTLGFSTLTIDDFTNANIVLFSSIILRYIANYDVEGRGLQNANAVQSFRLCIADELVKMLRYFQKLKATIPKNRLIKSNPDDEMLHKLKEEMFETFYTQNVKTVDVQLLIRQEKITYVLSENRGIAEEKVFVLEFQGLTISKDNQSSINQSISMAMQYGKQKTLAGGNGGGGGAAHDGGRKKVASVFSQLIKQAVVKEVVRKISVTQKRLAEEQNVGYNYVAESVQLNREVTDAEAKRASQLIHAINEQLNIFKQEEQLQNQIAEQELMHQQQQLKSNRKSIFNTVEAGTKTHVAIDTPSGEITNSVVAGHQSEHVNKNDVSLVVTGTEPELNHNTLLKVGEQQQHPQQQQVTSIGQQEQMKRKLKKGSSFQVQKSKPIGISLKHQPTTPTITKQLSETPEQLEKRFQRFKSSMMDTEQQQGNEQSQAAHLALGVQVPSSSMILDSSQMIGAGIGALNSSAAAMRMPPNQLNGREILPLLSLAGRNENLLSGPTSPFKLGGGSAGTGQNALDSSLSNVQISVTASGITNTTVIQVPSFLTSLLQNEMYRSGNFSAVDSFSPVSAAHVHSHPSEVSTKESGGLIAPAATAATPASTQKFSYSMAMKQLREKRQKEQLAQQALEAGTGTGAGTAAEGKLKTGEENITDHDGKADTTDTPAGNNNIFPVKSSSVATTATQPNAVDKTGNNNNNNNNNIREETKGSTENLLTSEQEGSSDEYDEEEDDDVIDDEDDYDDDEDDDGYSSDNVISMKQLNQTFSVHSENNNFLTGKNECGDRNNANNHDQSNSSMVRTFGRNPYQSQWIDNSNENKKIGSLNNNNNKQKNDGKQQPSQVMESGGGSQSATKNIRIINRIANDGSTPMEIRWVNLSIIWQMMIFMVFVVLLLSTISMSISSFQGSLEQLWFSTDISVPLNLLVIHLNVHKLFSMEAISAMYHEYVGTYSVESFEVLSHGYAKYLERQIVYEFQRDFKAKSVSVWQENPYESAAKSENAYLEEDIAVGLYLKRLILLFSDSIAYIGKYQISMERYPDKELNPMMRIAELFKVMNEEIRVSLDQEKLSIVVFNLIVYLVYQVMSVVLLAMNVYGAYAIKIKMEKLVKLISHITEREASLEILKGKACLVQLKSDNQEYLSSSFSAAHNSAVSAADTNSEEKHQRRKQKNPAAKNIQNYKKKNVYLCDRISESSIHVKNMYTIFVTAFVTCSSIGGIGLALLDTRLNFFNQVIQINSDFKQGVDDYAYLNIARDLLVVDELQQSRYSSLLLSESERKEWRAFFRSNLNSSTAYFSETFLSAIETASMPNEFYVQLSEIISNHGCCDLGEVFSADESVLCKQEMNGIVNNGLLNTILNSLENAQVADVEEAITFDAETYYDRNVVLLLQYRMMNRIIAVLQAQTEEQLMSISSSFTVFYVVAGVTNTLFLAFLFFALKSAFTSKFIRLRKGLLLLPIQRVSEDVNILSMIKANLQIKV